MASIITATNSNGLTHVADNSGVLQLASGTGNLVTIPSVTGTAMVSGNMPAFSAYYNTSSTFTTGTTTKVPVNTVIFDTASCFNTSTNRFTPNVAGYYQVNGKVRITGTAITANANIYKNGSLLMIGSYVTGTGSLVFSTTSVLTYMNGSTDYLELYGYGDATSGSPSFSYVSIGNCCEFSAVLVRGA